MESEAFTQTPPAQLLNRLRMRQLVLLLTIAEQGTLRAAAAELGMTQPTATKMLHELEEAMGHPLFARVGRRLKMTEVGKCVTSYFRGVRGTLESMAAEVKEIQRGGPLLLRVGSIMAASPEHLTNAILILKEEYPRLSINIEVGTSNKLIEHLNDGVIDLVIGRLPVGDQSNCIFHPMAAEELSVVVGPAHPLVNISEICFKNLLEYPWVLQPKGSPMRDVIEQEFMANHMAIPSPLIETPSVLTTTNLISKSQLIAIISQSIAQRYDAAGLLKIVPYKMKHELELFGTIVKKDRPVSVAVSRFMELLQRKNGPIDGPGD